MDLLNYQIKIAKHDDDQRLFMDNIKKTYERDVHTPFLTSEDTYKELSKYLDFEEVSLEKMDAFTKSYFRFMDLSKIKKTWILKENDKSSLFYKNHYMGNDKRIKICMYLDAEDRILSNNSMLEIYATIIRGISADDINRNYFKYCNYLNDIYLLNEELSR